MIPLHVEDYMYRDTVSFYEDPPDTSPFSIDAKTLHKANVHVPVGGHERAGARGDAKDLHEEPAVQSKLGVGHSHARVVVLHGLEQFQGRRLKVGQGRRRRGVVALLRLGVGAEAVEGEDLLLHIFGQVVSSSSSVDRI